MWVIQVQLFHHSVQFFQLCLHQFLAICRPSLTDIYFVEGETERDADGSEMKQNGGYSHLYLVCRF